MRLIDADKFKQKVERIAAKENPAFPAIIRANILRDLIDKQPTVRGGDIAPEMARAAYKMMRRYCAQRNNCEECLFVDVEGECLMWGLPGDWPELPKP